MVIILNIYILKCTKVPFFLFNLSLNFDKEGKPVYKQKWEDKNLKHRQSCHLWADFHHKDWLMVHSLRSWGSDSSSLVET